MSDRKLGPNAKKLLARFAARIAIPPGQGMLAGIKAIQNMAEITRAALASMDTAIAAMRAAPDKWYSDDEEEIAGIILAELEKKG